MFLRQILVRDHQIVRRFGTRHGLNTPRSSPPEPNHSIEYANSVGGERDAQFRIRRRSYWDLHLVEEVANRMIIAAASIVGSVWPPRQLIESFIAVRLDYRIEMVSSQGSGSALPCSVPPIALLSLERRLQNYAFTYTHPMPLMENPPTSLGLGCEPFAFRGPCGSPFR